MHLLAARVIIYNAFRLIGESEMSQGMPLISVIIPVYNAEKTLRRAIESLNRQQYDQLQIILVNDGSKDGSDALCKALQAEDGRIEYYAQANQGASGARNTALKYAKGDYYCFIDADDELMPNALPTMLESMQASNADLTIAHFLFAVGDISADRGRIKQDTVMTDGEFVNELVKWPTTFYFGVLWNKLYRGDIIRKNHLTFDEALDWGEDFAFNMLYLAHTKTVRALSQPVYRYFKAPNGLSVRTIIQDFGKACRTKWRMYGYYKTLCKQKGVMGKYPLRIRLYFISITLMD